MNKIKYNDACDKYLTSDNVGAQCGATASSVLNLFLRRATGYSIFTFMHPIK